VVRNSEMTKSASRVDTHQLPQRLILLSEDSQLQASVLLALGNTPAQIKECSTLRDAVDCLGSPGLDVVLIDTDLPGLDLTESLSRIRELSPDAALIVITSDNSVEMGKQIVEQRVFFYTIKPVNVWEDGAILEAAWKRLQNRLGPEKWSRAIS